MSQLPVGIISYGSYIPQWCIAADTIAEANQTVVPNLGVMQKTVPGIDEDTATMAVAAAVQALTSLPDEIQESVKEQIDNLWVGSESHPYAVKPTGTVVKAALGLSDYLAMADLQFACKAGTQGLQIALNYARAGQSQFGLAIGADTAQAAPGDALEYTAAAGAAAFLVGSDESLLIAKLLGTASVATDTPDFWRRPGQVYPQHGGRFTGEPAYFQHIMTATTQLLTKLNMHPTDFDHCVFHTPNSKFPRAVAKKLGCKSHQLKHSLVVEQIGNTYAGAALLAMTNVLDHAQPGDKILMTSYGSGAGADSFAWEVTPLLDKWHQQQTLMLEQQVKRLQPISYSQYRQQGIHE